MFGKDHLDTAEVIENIGTVLYARGGLTAEGIASYKTKIITSLEYENQGDITCRTQEYEQGLKLYRKGLKIEEKCLGPLHPTTCDLYLKMAVSNSAALYCRIVFCTNRCLISVFDHIVFSFRTHGLNLVIWNPV